MTEKRTRRKFSDQFRQQIVALYNSGKPFQQIAREYELHPSVLTRWINRINTTGSISEKANRSFEENELITLRKELKRLRMENDILKQAALIMGQK